MSALYNLNFRKSFIRSLPDSPAQILPTYLLLRHGIGLSTSSDSEMITQLLAYTPPQEQDDTPDWVAR